MFPHFYSSTGAIELPCAAVVAVHNMPLDEDGQAHVFPKGLE